MRFYSEYRDYHRASSVSASIFWIPNAVIGVTASTLLDLERLSTVRIAAVEYVVERLLNQ